LKHHFKKRTKSCFLKSEKKNTKYVFSNTVIIIIIIIIIDYCKKLCDNSVATVRSVRGFSDTLSGFSVQLRRSNIRPCLHILQASAQTAPLVKGLREPRQNCRIWGQVQPVCRSMAIVLNLSIDIRKYRVGQKC